MSHRTVYPPPVCLASLLAIALPGAALSGQAPIRWSTNGHDYELVSVSPPISWQEARAAAETRTYEGRRGHLLTFSEAGEQDWFRNAFAGQPIHGALIGALQLPSATEPGGGWGWVTGEPWVPAYALWAAGEPSNFYAGGLGSFPYGGTEEVGALKSGAYLNDIPDAPTIVTPRYVVEYEGAVADARLDVPGGPRDVALADLDLDGHLDLVAITETSAGYVILINDGHGAFPSPVTVTALAASDRAPVALAVGALDPTGPATDLAIACRDSHTVVVVRDDGGSRIAMSSPSGGLRPVCVAVADLDGSGRADLLVGHEGEPLLGGDGLTVHLDGGAPSTVTLPAGAPTRIAEIVAGDFDGDGALDVAALAQGTVDAVLLLRGDGAGTLSWVGSLPLGSSGLADGLCATDLDGDGDLDLVAGSSSLFPTPESSLHPFVAAPDGALDATDFTPLPALPALGTLLTDLAAGDFDGLACPPLLPSTDLAVAMPGSGDVARYYGFDGSTFPAVESHASGDLPVALAVGDLDGDGTDDLVVAHQAADEISVTSHEAPAAVRAAGGGCAGTAGLVPALGSDGVPELGSAFALTLAQARPTSLALLLWSVSLVDQPLGAGCRLHVAVPAPALTTFTDPLGAARFPLTVPDDPALAGLDLAFQGAVLDPAGSFAGVVALSNALCVQAGF